MGKLAINGGLLSNMEMYCWCGLLQRFLEVPTISILDNNPPFIANIYTMLILSNMDMYCFNVVAFRFISWRLVTNHCDLPTKNGDFSSYDGDHLLWGRRRSPMDCIPSMVRSGGFTHWRTIQMVVFNIWEVLLMIPHRVVQILIDWVLMCQVPVAGEKKPEIWVPPKSAAVNHINFVNSVGIHLISSQCLSSNVGILNYHCCCYHQYHVYIYIYMCNIYIYTHTCTIIYTYTYVLLL